MSTFQQYLVSPWLTSVRLVATSNQSGTYFNGPVNNGVGATFTYATGALSIDSVVVNVGDRILFSAQTSANQNGIYVCNVAGATGVSAILQRSADQQSIEQYRTGQYVSVGAGSVNAGNAFVLIEPLPSNLGIDNMSWASQPGAGAVTFSGGPSTANSIPVFADTAGNIAPQTTTATLPFGLTIQTGNLAVSQGNVTAGSSGHAGFFTSFPGTAANGSFVFKAINNSGGFVSTLSNSNIGQATVYSLPDPGAATSVLVSSQSSLPTNNITFTKVITATSAALATAGKVNIAVHPSATSQFAVIDIKVLKSTGLSGGAGDRLLAVSDGTIVFNNAGITAALLGTPILTVWGGTGNPLAVGASEVSTAGADIFLQYTGGANDYAAGSVQVAITLVQVTA